MAVERLDEAKLETLRRWGVGLSEDPREEVRAAGRAILMLIEEIEHLYVDLWHANENTPDDELPSHSLLARIRRLNPLRASAPPN